MTLSKPLHIVQPPARASASIEAEETEGAPAETPPARGPWPVGP